MPGGHRASWMRQTNKSHKTTHRSAREVNRIQGGKVRDVRATSVATRDSNRDGPGKRARIQKAAMNRKNKRQSLMASRRSGGAASLGLGSLSFDGAPRNVVIISLTEDADSLDVARHLAQFSNTTLQSSDSLKILPQTMVFPKEKLRVSVMVCDRSTLSVLDACKTADIVVFVLKVGARGRSSGNGLEKYLESSIDENGRDFIRLVKSQGKPSTIGVVQGVEDGVPAKYQTTVKKNTIDFFHEELGEDAKVVVLPYSQSENMENTMEEDEMESRGKVLPNVQQNRGGAWTLVRALGDLKLRRIAWRAERSYLLATAASPDANNEHMLCVSGFLRGRPMSIYQPVHIPGEGTFHVKKAVVQTDPFPLRSHAGAKEEGSQISREIIADEARLVPLKEEAEPDIMAGDQTWPTAEEMMEGTANTAEGSVAAMVTGGQIKKKGEGDYHALWMEAISDDEEGDANTDEVDMDGDEGEEDEDEYRKAYELYKEKRAMEQEDLEFPDEIDTPSDVPARLRFQKYRGLKSFRTSPWHPKESLPREYARVYSIHNFPHVEQHVLKDSEEVERKWIDGELGTENNQEEGDAGMMTIDENPINSHEMVFPGSYVTLYIDLSSAQGMTAVKPEVKAAALLDRLTAQKIPLVLGSLLEHEQKLSVIHFNVQRVSEFTEPILSREPLIVHCGLWRRPVCPTFSENNLNSDKHKFERFMQPNRWTVLSAYAPITFGSNVPVMVFKAVASETATLPRGSSKRALEIPKNPNVRSNLVATGTLIGANPDRIVLKKYVLSGHPLRVKKRWAVVRYMFFTPEDIKWFKPVQLWTKHGMSGRILDSVGTHGAMKCQFDRPIKNHDTICMSLYKRVFPRPIHEFESLRNEDQSL